MCKLRSLTLEESIFLNCTNYCGTEDEECNGSDIRGATCPDVGCNGLGSPTCTDFCRLDYSSCNGNATETYFKLELLTALDAWETSWVIKKDDKPVWEFDGSYRNHDPDIREVRCMETDSCYNFELSDVGGDGLNGGVSRKDSGNLLVSVDGEDYERKITDFGSLVVFNFGSCGRSAPNSSSRNQNSVTAFPSMNPSPMPSIYPTRIPTAHPSCEPTLKPSEGPSSVPSVLPTLGPTDHPGSAPSAEPSFNPSFTPTSKPTSVPSVIPTFSPSHLPTLYPTELPTSKPTCHPSSYPSNLPTLSPSKSPTLAPAMHPSIEPSYLPSLKPSEIPSYSPTTSEPSHRPTLRPSIQPTRLPTKVPSSTPTSVPPTLAPTICPAAPLQYSVIENDLATLTRRGQYCRRYKSLGIFATPDECASAAMNNNECGGYEIDFRTTDNWCTCCDEYVTENCVEEPTFFGTSDAYMVYQYSNPPSQPLCCD